MVTNSSISPADTAKSKRITFALFIISFFLHLAVVLAVRYYLHPTLWENGGIVPYLYEGKGFRIDWFGVTGELTSLQAPGYPVVLWAFWKMFGPTPTAYLLLSVTHCMAVASMVWPMGMLSRRWFPNVPAWIAQGLVVIYPLYLWYCTRIHHTAYVMAMHPWLLWTWLEWCRRGPWQGIGTGVFAAIAGLFQPVLLTVYAVCGAVLLAGAMLKKQWRAVGCLLLAAVAVVACLTPWTIRNYNVHGRLILVKSGMGEELWKGNNPHSTGTAYISGGTAEIIDVYPPKAYALCGKVPEMVMMDALDAEAWTYIKTHPKRTVEMTLRKLLWYWTLAPQNLVRHGMGGEAVTYRVVYIAYWAIVVCLAALGLLTARHPVKEYLAVLALYIACYSSVYGMTHVGQARYRGEMEFIFLFAAAAGLSFLWNLIVRKEAAPVVLKSNA